MAPTLPTELKHILELLYEDVRPSGYLMSPAFDTMDGEKVVCAFHPLLLVSRTFHALAHPIVVRHLFPVPSGLGATEMLDKSEAARLYLSKHCLGQAVRSVSLPRGLSEPRQRAFLLAFPSLLTLHAFSLPLDPHGVPASLTTLMLDTAASLDSTFWIELGRATPHLTALSLTGAASFGRGPLWMKTSSTPADPGWRLKHLAMHDLSGSEAQALALITSSAATLESLRLTCPSFNTQDPSFILPRLLSHLEIPVPRLRYLNLGEVTPLSRQCTVLDRGQLPNLEELHLRVNPQSLHQLLTISPTIVAVSVLAHLPLEASSSALDMFQDFVRGHPALRYISVDVSGRDSPKEDWYEDLQAQCDRLGITFASNTLVATEAELWTEEEDNGESETEEEMELRVEREDDALPLDFDAEDGEEWAHLWGEEKRQAMGLAPLPDSQLDRADAAESAAAASK